MDELSDGIDEELPIEDPERDVATELAGTFPVRVGSAACWPGCWSTTTGLSPITGEQRENIPGGPLYFAVAGEIRTETIVNIPYHYKKAKAYLGETSSIIRAFQSGLVVGRLRR